MIIWLIARSQFLSRILIPKSVQSSSLLSEKCFQDYVIPQVRDSTNYAEQFMFSSGLNLLLNKPELCNILSDSSKTFQSASEHKNYIEKIEKIVIFKN